LRMDWEGDQRPDPSRGPSFRTVRARGDKPCTNLPFHLPRALPSLPPSLPPLLTRHDGRQRSVHPGHAHHHLGASDPFLAQCVEQAVDACHAHVVSPFHLRGADRGEG
jgi:hypothetical protein